MLLLTVDGKGPGETIGLAHGGEVGVDLEILAEVGQVQRVQIVGNGQVLHDMELRSVPGDMQRARVRKRVTADRSMWIAARAFSTSFKNLPDGEAHTNPVYLSVGGKPVYERGSAEWLAKKLEEYISTQENRQFARAEALMQYLESAREALRSLPDPGR
jgi:hypothetical protein